MTGRLGHLFSQNTTACRGAKYRTNGLPANPPPKLIGDYMLAGLVKLSSGIGGLPSSARQSAKPRPATFPLNPFDLRPRSWDLDGLRAANKYLLRSPSRSLSLFQHQTATPLSGTWYLVAFSTCPVPLLHACTLGLFLLPSGIPSYHACIQRPRRQQAKKTAIFCNRPSPLVLHFVAPPTFPQLPAVYHLSIYQRAHAERLSRYQQPILFWPLST